MSRPILATKLYIPPIRPNFVLRPRLVERLNEGLGRKLSLVSASAGCGKTTLISGWVGGTERPIAWLSLDEGDNDLTHFLRYLVAALQKIDVGLATGTSFGERVLELLQSSQPISTELVLATFLNEIAAISAEFILVLDDYHLIESKAVDDALAFLLEQQPPQMHLVITTREDPPLPLARLRARGQLTELRALDLRFTVEETADFLNHVMGLNLSVDDIKALEGRTEGWIAGLQLAALALQGSNSVQRQKDTAHFIQAFTGSHRFVLDYLMEEVLQQQTEAVRNFLLQTAVLERLSGPLCDAVRFGIGGTADTGQKDGKWMLAALERGNLFVVPLDDQRQWYRYHHLFADVLKAHMMAERPEQVSMLHLRASDWYEQNEFRSEAIHHALAARDFERAADLIELAWPEMERNAETARWLGWVRAIPEVLLQVRPVLCVDYVWALLGGGSGELELAQALLGSAERCLDEAVDSERTADMIIVDEDQHRSLPAAIAIAKAYIALALGDVPSSVAYAQQTRDLLPNDETHWHGIADVFLGIAYWRSGDLEAAFQTFSDFMRNMLSIGETSGAISITAILGDIRIVQGKLLETMRIYEKSLDLIKEEADTVIRGTAELYVGLGVLYAERGELETAEQHLLKSEELGERAELLGNAYRLYPAKAQLKAALGDLEGALSLLDEAERRYYRTPLPNVQPISARRTRLWIKQGKLTEALGWVRERDLSVEDELSYLAEFEHITLARTLIAQYRNETGNDGIQGALGLLERLWKAAEAGGRLGSVIEILALLAVAHEAKGDIFATLGPLEQALTLAEPQGYVRLFVDEGPPMAKLLREAAKRGIAPKYVSRLLATFGDEVDDRAVVQALADPLSERELDVLGLLVTDLNGPDIARELMVSLNTMRTHTKNIYSKLGVNSRRTAVRRAQELGLLSEHN